MSAHPPLGPHEDALVLLLDPDGWIEMIGPHPERLTGWAEAQLRRKNFEIFSAQDATGPVRNAMLRAMGEGRLWRCEATLAAPNGARLPCRLALHPLEDDTGRKHRYVCTVRPPAEFRTHAEEVERAHAQAAEAAREKNEFLRSMSHELRTPMNGIVGMADHLLAGELEPGQRADVVTLRRSAGELLSVLGELLAFSGLESDAAAAEHVPFRLRPLLRELDTQVLPEASHRGLAWEVTVAPGVPDWLEGDPGRLRHVLGRLADNAIKYTERGSVKLVVRAERAEGARAHLTFELTDTGIGIPEPQQRALGPHAGEAGGRYAGAGLGLALASRQIDSMGGRLEVRSRVGEGSTFRFTLVLPRVPEVAPAAGGLAPDARVLLLGGGAGARADGARLLRRLVPGLVEAGSVGEAADRLIFAGEGAGPIRAVVIDARGATFDAFEVVTALAPAGSTPVPTLLLVTAGQRGDAERCRELGIGAYLTSPVTEADLREALAALLRPGARTRTAAAAALVTRHSLREARRNPRALVVDDVAVNRTIAARLLERAGYEVDLADGGREALERFAAARYDVVLMDVGMPGMDGIETTRRLRELERARGARRTPVVAVTAHALESDRAAVRESGMDGFLPKPVDPDVLFGTLARIAAGEAAGAAEPPAPPPPADVVDRPRAPASAGGEEAVRLEVLQLFVHEAPALRRRLALAREGADLREMEGAARSARAAGTLAFARGVTALAARAEQAAAGGRVDEARAALAALDAEIERLVRAIAAGPDGLGHAA